VKILNLQMIAYGPFTDWSLDLSKGSEGLHLIYGLNEAGKSAALRGLKALLFGIEERTTDHFAHEYSKLRVAGCIRHSDGRELAVVRRKGRSKTLLAPDDSVLDERILEAFLGGIEPEAFSRLFGIDHQELAQGGKDIVSGKGDVGESLFAAAIGGFGIHRILGPLENEASNLFSNGKPVKFVKSWLLEYHDAVKEAKEASLPSREWEEHTRLLKEAGDQKTRLSEELGRRNAELRRLERIRDALPYLSRRKELQLERAQLGEVLLLPIDFSERRRKNDEAIGRAKEEREGAEKKLEELKSRLQAIRLPETLIDEAGAITRLHQSMGSYTKSMQDLPKRIGEAEQLETEAAAILKDVRPGTAAEFAETLSIGLAKKQSIRELGARYEALSQMLQQSEKSADSLRKKLAKARADFVKAEAHRDTGPLRDLLKRVQRSGDLEAALSRLRSDLSKEIDQAEIELNRLPLWTKSLEALELVPVPADETISKYEAAWNEFEQNLKSKNSALADLQTEESDLIEKIKSLELTRAVPGESDLSQARARRQTGWNLVRTAWLEGREEKQGIEAFAGAESLDKAYETSVHAADEVADRLRMEADRVAQHAAWIAQRDRTCEQVNRINEEIRNLTAGKDGLKAEWRELWHALGIEPLSPEEMRNWIQKQRLLVQRAERIRLFRTEIREHEAHIQEMQREIRSVIDHVGQPQPSAGLNLNALIDHCQSLLEMIEAANAARQQLESGIRDLESQFAEAQEGSRRATSSLQEWQDKWTEAVKQLGLAGTDSPATAGVLLDKIQELMEKNNRAAGLRKRIEAMQRDANTFAVDVRDLAARVEPELQSSPPDLAVKELAERLTQGRADQATMRELQDQQLEQQRLWSGAEKKMGAADEELQKICELAGCRDPKKLDEIENRSNRVRQIDEDLNTVSQQLLAFAGGGTVDDLAAEAETIDPDTLLGEIAVRREEQERLKGELSIVEQAIGRETAELARMDGSSRAADAAEKAQSSLAQIRTGLERYAGLRLASIILHGEIGKYRAAHEGPVLKRASDIFAALTVGSFVGLKTEFDGNDRPLLVGARASGEKVGVEGMSDGTCDQLYLSLRLASLENHLGSHEPMPFVIDDILVNFDDSRAEATMKVLADLSRKTQVIFFTHHQHLVGIAEKSVASDILHVHPM
jgi:uncharacterized protein YhaN